MYKDNVDFIREYASLLKGLSVVSDIYNAAKVGENVTAEEEESAQFFLIGISRILAFRLKELTDMLK